jgi:hypothetical protein
MPEPKDGATTTGNSTETGESLDPIAEAVAKATQGVTDFGGAEEAATDDEGDTGETADDESGETAEGDSATEGDQADTEGEDDGEALYTSDDFDDLRPGEQMNVPLKSVHPDHRDYVRRAKANLSRAFQAAAQRGKRTGDDDTEERATTPKEKAPTYTRDELFEMAQESPEGFERANEILMEQKLDALLAKRNIKAPSAEDRAAEILDEAVNVAIANKYDELTDKKFREEVGSVLATDEILARRMNKAINAEDADGLSMVIERAADRVREKRYKQTEAARAKSKIAKETETARERGSVAATSTTRSAPAPAKKGPIPVEDAVGEAVKAAGGNAFR